ncbi:unnamed protein product [Zymoseptoria tritici ST99CH_3D7]|uniref:Ketoreductase (KR) domain-containing protein n=1 Tax=Zymoseptoria tritici (strain ST99CH_3D7) TaxID=1276538 RepID=A0A1X7S9V0_ZYMT9|nr:unnamed protein product [Zymoseptoria tritici ST99CH_3D7]
MSLTPPPSAWWTLYQVLIKGTNFSHLPAPTADLRNKNIIITGGNSGIGREAALQLARYGANITLGCRSTIPSHEEHPSATVLACRAAAQESGHLHSTITWLSIDLSSFTSVSTFASTWLASNKPIHLLLNNAGVPKKAGVTLTTPDGFELLHQVNFLSHALLTLLLLPSLATAPAPRIIFTTSCLHYIPPSPTPRPPTPTNPISPTPSQNSTSKLSSPPCNVASPPTRNSHTSPRKASIPVSSGVESGTRRETSELKETRNPLLPPPPLLKNPTSPIC